MALVDSRTGDLELSLKLTTGVGYSWVTNSRLRKPCHIKGRPESPSLPQASRAGRTYH
jgi:hypothetical protein